MTARVLSALATALVLTACGAPTPYGAARVPGGELAAMRKTGAQAAPAKAIAFAQLVVTEASALRDGGTLIAKGYVTRSTYVTIKLDGGLSSPTRGQLLVESHDFQQQAGPLRQALPEELPALATALRGNTARAGAGLDVQLLGRLADAVDALAAAGQQPAKAGAVTGLAIEKLPVRCPCFQLKATYDGKPLAIKYEGMPGAYTIQTVELAGKPATPEERKAIAAALVAAAADAGRQAMIVEEVAEALAK